jgi:hypothetical protein
MSLFGATLFVLVESGAYHERSLCVRFVDRPAAVAESFLREPLRITATLGALRPGVPIAV